MVTRSGTVRIGGAADLRYGLLRMCTEAREWVVGPHLSQSREPAALDAQALSAPMQLLVRVHLHVFHRIKRTPVRVEGTGPQVKYVNGEATGDRLASRTEKPKMAPLPARPIGRRTLGSGELERRRCGRRHGRLPALGRADYIRNGDIHRNGENRTWSHVQKPLRDAAEQHPHNAAVTSSSHDD